MLLNNKQIKINHRSNYISKGINIHHSICNKLYTVLVNAFSSSDTLFFTNLQESQTMLEIYSNLHQQQQCQYLNKI